MPAANAGIRAGDVIARFEEGKVRSPRDITCVIRAAPVRGVTAGRPQDFQF